MENQANSKNIIINYGLILGALMILMSLTSYATGTHLDPHWTFKAFGIVAFIVLIVFGIKNFKKTNNSFLSFGDAIKIGVGVAIISALVSGLYNYIFMNFIEPDFMNQAMELQTEKYIDAGMSDEQIDASQEMGKKFSNPFLIIAFGIIGSAIGGFIVSAIAGAIMKKTEEDQY